MKKILLLFITFICSMCLNAQELQIQSSATNQKVVFEYMPIVGNHIFYAYAEVGLNDVVSMYIQTFYEYSLHILNLHAEYRAFSIHGSKSTNTYIAGISIPVIAKDSFYFNIAPLYRYSDKHQWQASFVYGACYKNLSLSGYFDLYGDKSIDAFSENKIKLHFNKYFIGTNLEYALDCGDSSFTPYLLLGIKF